MPASARSVRAGAAGDHPAGPDEQQLVAAVGLVHDVAGHDDRGPGVREGPEVAPELDPEQRVDADRGLVEEQRPCGRWIERAGERQPPPLAARERARDGVLARSAELDQRERVVDERRVAGTP